jgi:hypothetical protein
VGWADGMLKEKVWQILPQKKRKEVQKLDFL